MEINPVLEKELDPKVKKVLLERCEELVGSKISSIDIYYGELGLTARLELDNGFEYEFYLNEAITLKGGDTN